MKHSLFFSRYTFFFEQDGITAAYHSLKLKPIYYSSILQQIIEVFYSKIILTDFFDEINNHPEIEDVRELIEVLVDAGLLISSNDQDEDELAKNLEKIRPPYINVAYFVLTDACNFNCEYCFILKNSEDGGFGSMSRDTAFRGLNLFCETIKDVDRFEEKKKIVLYGGEPLLNLSVVKFLLKKIAAYKEKGYLPLKTEVSIVTNGSLVTSEIASLFKRYRVNVIISYDGPNGNNRYRIDKKYRSSNKLIGRGIDICRQAGLDFGISSTLSEDSVQSNDGLIEALINTGAKNVGFNILLTNKNVNVPEWYQQAAANFLIRAYEVLSENGISEDRMGRKVNSFLNSKVYLYDCAAAGGNQLAIFPNGNIAPCHGYLSNKDKHVANVYDTTFIPKQNKLYLEWNKRTPLYIPQCQSCSGLGICGGGCAFNAELNKGTIWELDDRFCIHCKTTLDWLIWSLYKQIS